MNAYACLVRPFNQVLKSNAACCWTVKVRRSPHTSAVCLRIFECPTEPEYEKLKKSFPDPQKILHKLMQPLVDSASAVKPYVIFTSHLRGMVWKAKLHVSWPRSIAFTGVHTDQKRAEENAYLLACDLYGMIGMITFHDGAAVPVDENHVFGILEKLYLKDHNGGAISAKYHMTVHRCTQDDNPTWHAQVQVSFPRSFCLSSSGSTLQSAQYSLCLLTCSKMRLLRMLDCENHLKSNVLHKIYSEASVLLPKVNREEFNPDYEIYVDTSQVGFGAYLLTRDDDKVRWISDAWPEHFKDNNLPLVKFSSTFYEYYALVAACYTWKHKFVNSKVLCWSDNSQAVDLVNKGPSPTRDTHKIDKLYQIMSQMCSIYKITLKSLHIHRKENQPADHLSRLEVDKFREYMPEARYLSKKTKKLLFCKPLVCPSQKPDPPPKTPCK